MSINGDDPAFPTVYQDVDGVTYTISGLTKREHFAALAMQGIAANGEDLYATDVAQLAVMYADRLIAALNEEPAP